MTGGGLRSDGTCSGGTGISSAGVRGNLSSPLDGLGAGDCGGVKIGVLVSWMVSPRGGATMDRSGGEMDDGHGRPGLLGRMPGTGTMGPIFVVLGLEGTGRREN